MTDEQLRIIEEFAAEYEQAPSNYPFDQKAAQALAKLIESGVDESEGKRLLRDAATPEDDRDFRRPDAHASVGDALTAK
jgi:hypothetical protein